MRAPRPSTFLFALAALVVAAPAPAGAKIVLRTFDASVDVKLDLTIDATFESSEKCVPGEKASGSYDFDFESGGKGTPTRVEFNLINGVGGNTKPSLGAKGRAVETGKLTGGWEFNLDDCVESTDVTLPAGVTGPVCKPLAGRVEAWLALVPPSSSAGLTALASDGKLIFYRRGGGGQDPSCLRYFQDTASPTNIFSFKLSTALVSAAGRSSAFGVTLPNMSKQMTSIITGGKSSFTRRFSVSGPCYAILGKASIGPTFGSPRYETCAVKGDGLVIVRRFGKVKTVRSAGTVPPSVPTIPMPAGFE